MSVHPTMTRQFHFHAFVEVKTRTYRTCAVIFSLRLVYNNPKPEPTQKSADEKMKIEKNNVCNVVLQTIREQWATVCNHTSVSK